MTSAGELRVEQYFRAPRELERVLRDDGALDFPTYESGMPAASGIGDPKLAGITGMDKFGWGRDACLVFEALLLRGDEGAGDIEKARHGGQAFLTVLHGNEGRLNDAIRDPDAPPMVVRVNARTLENDREQREQFDSVAYWIRLPSILALRSLIQLSRDDLAMMGLGTRYLDARRYWHGPDEGIWEEERRPHSSSRGVVISTLDKVMRVFDSYQYRPQIDLDALIGKGEHVFDATIRNYGETPPEGDYPGRFYDASHAILVEVMRLFEYDAQGGDLLMDRVERLAGSVATRRYLYDTYEAPGFRRMFKPGEGTTQGEGKLELRATLAAETRRTDSEAQWPFTEGYSSAYRGRRYEQTHVLGQLLKQVEFLQRNVNHYIPTPRGRRVPELFRRETPDGPWIPSDHIPLLMAQAATVHALEQFKRTAPAMADAFLR